MKFKLQQNSLKVKNLIFAGEGPRICIGLRFALMAVKIAIIKLLMKYNFDQSSKPLIPMKYSVKSLILSPDNDELFLKVERN